MIVFATADAVQMAARRAAIVEGEAVTADAAGAEGGEATVATAVGPVAAVAAGRADAEAMEEGTATEGMEATEEGQPGRRLRTATQRWMAIPAQADWRLAARTSALKHQYVKQANAVQYVSQFAKVCFDFESCVTLLMVSGSIGWDSAQAVCTSRY